MMKQRDAEIEFEQDENKEEPKMTTVVTETRIINSLNTKDTTLALKKLSEIRQTGTVTLYLVRHGERLDEVRGNTFRENCGEQWYNPPLTEVGKTQAYNTAIYLKTILKKLPPILHVSPLSRTVQTAAEIANCLNSSIELVPGLAHCAAAFSSGNVLLQQSSFLSESDIVALCPSIKLVEYEWIDTDTFIDCIIRLCLLSGANSEVVCITHREAMRNLSKSHLCTSGKSIHSTPYCCVAKFTYNLETKTFESHGIISNYKEIYP
ncbi:unnamed protein product [Didymodactylos carnosus]|uniref:Phosphoglycerate mutase family protein n=1 Tax=Didymodactylos carnosus TaxID=1234261 RepID=A0A815XIP1_9BILA|nr:unnamed protein product [Didymodactylos carnosus]CAF4419654.1 unnamed protein product [Didymodactylos carnosus]